jgi:hypothetical protein
MSAPGGIIDSLGVTLTLADDDMVTDIVVLTRLGRRTRLPILYL